MILTKPCSEWEDKVAEIIENLRKRKIPRNKTRKLTRKLRYLIKQEARKEADPLATNYLIDFITKSYGLNSKGKIRD